MINMSNRIFQFWEYKVSHGSLLIRSPMKEEQQYNIDIKFFGVLYLSIPRHFKGITIVDANRKEEILIKKQIGQELNNSKIFVLESQNSRYLVVASQMKIDKNELDIFDSVF